MNLYTPRWVPFGTPTVWIDGATCGTCGHDFTASDLTEGLFDTFPLEITVECLRSGIVHRTSQSRCGGSIFVTQKFWPPPRREEDAP